MEGGEKGRTGGGSHREIVKKNILRAAPKTSFVFGEHVDSRHRN